MKNSPRYTSMSPPPSLLIFPLIPPYSPPLIPPLPPPFSQVQHRWLWERSQREQLERRNVELTREIRQLQSLLAAKATA